MITKRKISILGCGWIGKILYDELHPNYEVNCLSKDLEENNKLNLYNVDILVIAIPPKNNYLEVLEQTLGNINRNTYVILLSSISFYKNKLLVVDAENLVKKKSENYVILRLGGLMGYDRIAGKYSAGKTLSDNLVTNYIHRDDVVSIIQSLITKEIYNEVFDVVAPVQSTQKEVFSKNAKRFGFAKTVFLNDIPIGQSLSPLKLIEKTGYIFKKEKVIEFW